MMSNQNRIHHVAAGEGPVYWGPGDRIRFILTGAETGGAFSLRRFWSRRDEARHPIFTSARTRHFTFSRGL